MDMLKKFFPYSFGAKDVTALVIKIIVYVVAIIIGSVLLGLVGLITGWIPVLGTVILVYCVIGIVLLILDYLKVLK